jgi:YggT family protein
MTNTIFLILNILFRFLEIAILIEVFLSWMPRQGGRTNQLIEFVHALTAPLMAPGKKIQNALIPNLMIDFSPIIALVLLDIIKRVLYTIL